MLETLKTLGKAQASPAADSTGSLISGDLRFDLSAEAPQRGDKRAQPLARQGPQIEHSTVPGGLHICLAPEASSSRLLVSLGVMKMPTFAIDFFRCP